MRYPQYPLDSFDNRVSGPAYLRSFLSLKLKDRANIQWSKSFLGWPRKLNVRAKPWGSIESIDACHRSISIYYMHEQAFYPISLLKKPSRIFVETGLFIEKPVSAA